MNIKMLELAQAIKEECENTYCTDCPLRKGMFDCIIAPDVDGAVAPSRWELHKAFEAQKGREG